VHTNSKLEYVAADSMVATRWYGPLLLQYRWHGCYAVSACLCGFGLGSRSANRTYGTMPATCLCGFGLGSSSASRTYVTMPAVSEGLGSGANLGNRVRMMSSVR